MTFMNIFQIIGICGMLAPIIYTVNWIIIGTLQSGYSHIKTDISALFAVGAPNKRVFQSINLVSAILLFIFYIGLHEGIGDGGSIIGPIFFLISGVLGILVGAIFPLDEGGELTTSRGKMHLTLIVVSGILVIVGIILMWLRLEYVVGWISFATFSLITAIVSFVLVIIAGIFGQGNYRGLVERIMVTPYQVYPFVLGLLVFLSN